LPGDDLIRGNGQSNFNAGLRAIVGMHSGQPHSRGTRMISSAIAEGIGLQMSKIAENVDLALERLQRLQDRRQVEGGARGRWRPLFLNHAVGDVDETETWRSRRGCGQRRRHGIQERKRQCGARASQKSPPGQRFLCDEHHRASYFPRACRIWNGALCTIPSTNVANW